MKNYLKHISKLIAILAVATSPICGYEYEENNQHNNNHAIPPPQHHPGEDSLTFRIGADYTFWVPYQAMSPAFTQETPAENRGATIYPKMDGRSGFKVNAGANLHHDGWRIDAKYTWFYNNASLRSPPNSTAPTYYVTTYSDTTILITAVDTVIKTSFKNWFNRIDVVIDRSFYAGHYLAFRPWIGILGAWDSQDLHKTFVHAKESTGIRHKQDWDGVGPYSGVESTYYVMDEFGIFLSGGGALLLTKNKSNVVRKNDITDVIGYQNDSTVRYVEPMMETSIGLVWESVWTDWALRVKAAWELQTYFSHGLYFIGDIKGDYSMQGLTAGISVDF